MNSKRLASTICALTFLGVAGFLVTSSHSAPADNGVSNPDCVGCAPMTKTQIDMTNPDTQKASLARALVAAQERQAARAARNMAKHLALFQAWHGTKFSVRDTVEDQATIDLHQAVCDVFSANPAAPAARARQFKEWLAPGSQVRCVGYYGVVESATPNANGWLAVIKMAPTLMNKAGGVAFTPYACDEEWQIGKDSSLKNLSSKADPKTTAGVLID